jgi:hypothetical protein
MKVGERYSMLTISRPIDGNKVWAMCDCGKEKEFYASNIYGGKSTSCGCRNKLASSERFSSYNMSKGVYGLSLHPLYSVWTSMISRCYNVNDISFKRYGLKGVSVCEEWKNDFNSFYNWAIKNGFKEGLQLDKDYLGNGMIYSPDFCQFVTRSKNCRKRKTSRYIEYNGETKTLAEWCEIYNLNHSAVIKRIERGWDNSEIFKPSRHAI